MYANIRSALFQLIPGYCVSDLVYLGVIVFIIAGFIATKKWTPFFASLILISSFLPGHNFTIICGIFYSSQSDNIFFIILPKGSGIKIVHLNDKNSKPENFDKY